MSNSTPKKSTGRKLTPRDEKFVDKVAIGETASRSCFIYGIKSKDGPMFYIGSAFDVEKRFATHLRDCRNDRHINALFLQKALEIGLENLSYDIIDSVAERDRLSTEYGHIELFTQRGVDLVNIIRTERQQEYFIRAKTVVKERCHDKAFRLLLHSLKHVDDLCFLDHQRLGMRMVIQKCREIFAYPSSIWANSVFGQNVGLAALLLEVRDAPKV